MPAQPVLIRGPWLQVIPQDLLRKYITYAKQNVAPKLHDADLNKLAQVYADLRRESMVSPTAQFDFDAKNDFKALQSVVFEDWGSGQEFSMASWLGRSVSYQTGPQLSCVVGTSGD
jgi:hypothetical protein